MARCRNGATALECCGARWHDRRPGWPAGDPCARLVRGPPEEQALPTRETIHDEVAVSRPGEVHGLPAVRDGLLVRAHRHLQPGQVAHQGLQLRARRAARCPTPARSAPKRGACRPAPSRRSSSIRPPARRSCCEATCVGCKVCTIACPFGTINYVADTGKVQKCDLCGGDPACAAACPTGAITYVDADWTGLEKMRQWAGRANTAVL